MQRLKPIIHQVRQRSDEWFQLRLGKVTGSEAKKTLAFSSRIPASKRDQASLKHQILGTKKSKLDYLLERDNLVEYCLSAGIELSELAERKGYRENIIAERLTGLPADPDPYVSHDMKWGIVNEDLAKTIYQMQNHCIVEEAGFFEHPELAAGISPDGISTDTKTGEIGLVEVKCLRSANHLFKIIETQEVPHEFYDQIQMQMWISGHYWCDFIGFDSRLPEGLKVFVKRVEFDEEYVSYILEPSIRRFLEEVSSKEKHFRALIRESQ